MTIPILLQCFIVKHHIVFYGFIYYLYVAVFVNLDFAFLSNCYDYATLHFDDRPFNKM